jgi:hypothetical protein
MHRHAVFEGNVLMISMSVPAAAWHAVYEFSWRCSCLEAGAGSQRMVIGLVWAIAVN